MEPVLCQALKGVGDFAALILFGIALIVRRFIYSLASIVSLLKDPGSMKLLCRLWWPFCDWTD